ncbi:unnamed protein product [Amoebophrya sp. A120]|nr:unnamed protein product [Amoebophrya sp. A120]|eukprot:GSA120T00003407001.1
MIVVPSTSFLPILSILIFAHATTGSFAQVVPESLAGVAAPPNVPSLSGDAPLPALGKNGNNAAANVVHVQKPLTKSIADQVTDLLNQVGRQKEANVISKLLNRGLGPSAGEELQDPTKQLASPENGAETEEAALANLLPGTSTKNLPSRDSVGNRIKHWQPPEEAAPLAVEGALAAMQRRQLENAKEKVDAEKKKVRDLQLKKEKKRIEKESLQRKVKALEEELQRLTDQEKRAQNTLEMREKHAQGIENRMKELEGILNESQLAFDPTEETRAESIAEKLGNSIPTETTNTTSASSSEDSEL